MDEERSELEDLTAGYIARGEAEGLASDAQGIADRAWDEGAHDGMGDVATPDLPPRPTDPEAVGGPFGEGKAAGSSPVSRGRRRLMPVIVAVIVAVLAVGTAAGVMAWRGNVAAKALSDARPRCVDSLAKAGTARDAYMQAVAAASDMKTVKSDQVADPKVVAALASELDAKTPKTPPCTAGAAARQGTPADALDAPARWYATHEANVKTASENVGRSRDEKTLGDARKALADKESAARKLLKDSDGKTGDDVARAKLTQAINTAVEAGKGTDVRKMDDARSALDKAMKSVNDAVGAKRKADAAAAEAAKRARSSASNNYGGTSNHGNGTTGNGGYRYSGGTSSKRNTGNSIPSGSGGSGDTPQSKGWGCGDNCSTAPSDGHGCNPVTGACGIG